MGGREKTTRIRPPGGKLPETRAPSNTTVNSSRGSR
jgi:hypothetical protein